MENILMWGKAEKVIARALEEAEHARGQLVAGWSVPTRIAEALRAEGLLNEEEP
jgi:hypothetical protein